MPQPYPICLRCSGLYEQDTDPLHSGMCPDCRAKWSMADLNGQKLDRIIELLGELINKVP